MGKTRETSNEIDPYLSGKERNNLARSEKAALIPYLPNMGGTVAGFTPTQLDAFNMGDQAASAFGFTPSGYTPPEGEMNRGIMTHSPGDWYQDMKDESIPQAMQDYIDSFFIDPVTGKRRGGGGGNRRRGAVQGGIFDRVNNAGDGRSQYGGGAGWSRDPYSDPVSGGRHQYGTSVGPLSRAAEGVIGATDRMTGGGGNGGDK